MKISIIESFPLTSRVKVKRMLDFFIFSKIEMAEASPSMRIQIHISFIKQLQSFDKTFNCFYIIAPRKMIFLDGVT